MTHRKALFGTVARVVAGLSLCLALCASAAAQAPPPMPSSPGSSPSSPSSITRLPTNNPPPSEPSNDCGGACGIIESIRQTTTKDQWTPLGMGAGIGGAPSNLGDGPAAVTSFQIGPGFTNQGMLLLGSAGGASYRKAPNSYERPRWELTVKLDSGGVRLVTLAYEPYVREGDHVRVSGNNVELLDQ
jgi:hypothetical protein